MPSRLFRIAILPAALLAAAPAHANTASDDVTVCALADTSGQYRVRVRNTGSTPLTRADVSGVRLDDGGQAQGHVNVSLTDIAPGTYATAILARHGESAALVGIATYRAIDGVETRQQEWFAGKVVHVSPGSTLPYTLAPLATRGWTVAYGGPHAPALKTGSAVLLRYPARGGNMRDTQPQAGRLPADVTPFKPCPVPSGR